MKPEIRKARYSDIPAIAGMLKDFHDESGWEKFGLGYDTDDTLRWIKWVTESTEMDIVVVANEKPVGFAVVGFRPWLLRSEDLIAFELFLYLSPEYRKGNTGKRLIVELETIAKERGAKVMEVGTVRTTGPGRWSKLLERVGFSASMDGYMKVMGGEHGLAK